MALAKGTNSYADVSEADTYFGDRLDASAWVNATETRKSQALITATNQLDGFEYVGTAVSELQSLAFPRNGSYFDPRLGIDVLFDDTEPPTRIVNATFELALHLLSNEGLLDATGTVKNLQVGPIKLDEINTPPNTPSMVKRLIKPLRVNAGSSLWWRAN